MVAFDRNPQDFKYLRLLSRQFPTEQSAFTEIINLSAILNLPKGTEHFMSDVHGEYEAFMHILNNCSGVVREHVDEIFGDTLSFDEKGELCTLIYYPREKIELVRSRREDSPTWYKTMLDQLIVVARSLSSRYTRSKVRKAIPRDYAYIIDELLHTHPDENNYRVRYHERIIESILETASADDFIESFPDKYNTYIEQGGTNVSGGQKQRLCIARALLKKPRILILDDSTSAVDTATDSKIRAALAKTIPGTTKLIIAQRISSVMDADRIIVMNDGKVDGFDTPENLLKNNEIYRDVYDSQTNGGGDFDEGGAA